MDRLKESILQAGKDKTESVQDRVEVIGLSIASCLNRAAKHWDTDLMALDYEIIEKAKKNLLTNKPYRIQVKLLPNQENEELKAFSLKLGLGERLIDEAVEERMPSINKDGEAAVRNYLNGVFLTIFPPKGEGRPVSRDVLTRKLQQAGIQNYDNFAVEEALAESAGKALKVAEFVHNPGADSSCKIEISPDNMKAFAHVSAPRRGGRHLKVEDIVANLKAHGVLRGLKEREIERTLLSDDYTKPILAAEGLPPKKGVDAKIDYKVNLKKNVVNLREDASGRVDFKNLSKIENVVVGQIIAEKIPSKKGKHGFTIFNEIVPAKDGKDVILKPGKGTILVDNGMRLSAEINGQVILTRGRVSVEPVHRIAGNVGPKTGNINFLGSVYIGGTVLSGFDVKASGNIEIQGGVQKAKIEAEGDIFVRSGIHGGTVESTGASVLAKFIQDADIYAHANVLVSDGILRSEVKAEDSIICHGRRAQIVAGHLWATNEIRARTIGSSAYAATELWVGVNPFTLDIRNKNIKSLEETVKQISSLEKSLKTLEARKRTETGKAKEEREKKLQETKEELAELQASKQELEAKLAELEREFEGKESPAKIHTERQIFPGVVLNLLKAKQNITNTQGAMTFSYEGGYIKSGKLEKMESDQPSYHRWKR